MGLREQGNARLLNMYNAGKNADKSECIRKGTDGEMIFSYSTYKDYTRHCGYFFDYMEREHPKCDTLGAARKYVPKFLKKRKVDGGEAKSLLSAWTVVFERQALCKLFGIKRGDAEYFKVTDRNMIETVRSRKEVVRHFSLINNDELIRFCRGTGLRRGVLGSIKGSSLVTREKMLAPKGATDAEAGRMREMTEIFPEAKYFIRQKDAKGDVVFTPVIGPDEELIAEKFRKTQMSSKVWPVVHSNADIDGFRAEFVKSVYEMYARRIEDIPYDRIDHLGNRVQTEVFHFKGTLAGEILDKKAMMKAMYAMGVRRIEQVAHILMRYY